MSVQKPFSISSYVDGLVLSCLAIEPEGEPKGIVQLVHGMCEYKERYIPFMEYLADHGYVTVIHDHRGHGHSVQSTEDLGYMYTGGYEALIEDTHQVSRWIKDYVHKNIPFILLGHSMGSFVVRCYIRKYDREIDKLIVVGSPSPQPGVGLGKGICRMLKTFKGEKAKSRMLDVLTMGGYEKYYKNENTLHAWINSDKEKVAAYSEDPLCAYTFSVNGYDNLIRLNALTYQKTGWEVGHPDLPIRFFSGEGDPCAITPKKFRQAVQFLRDRGYTDVEGKMYPGMRHEVLNEPDHEIVFKDMLAFIEE